MASRTLVYVAPSTDDAMGDSRRVAGWFDADKAKVYRSGKELLYRTAEGRWVLQAPSRLKGRPDDIVYVGLDEARTRLVAAGEDAAVEEWFGSPPDSEEEVVLGRPEIGPALNVRFTPDQIACLNNRAAVYGTSRAELIRRYVEFGLAHYEERKQPGDAETSPAEATT